MDARQYRVHQIAAPPEEERLHPWQWRFWHRLPRDGRVAIFDRSWYGRVLVERVEGLADERDWRRGFEEIRQFEARLLELDGVESVEIEEVFDRWRRADVSQKGLRQLRQVGVA